jgi:hypothetical protein
MIHRGNMSAPLHSFRAHLAVVIVPKGRRFGEYLKVALSDRTGHFHAGNRTAANAPKHRQKRRMVPHKTFGSALFGGLSNKRPKDRNFKNRKLVL